MSLAVWKSSLMSMQSTPARRQAFWTRSRKRLDGPRQEITRSYPRSRASASGAVASQRTRSALPAREEGLRDVPLTGMSGRRAATAWRTCFPVVPVPPMTRIPFFMAHPVLDVLHAGAWLSHCRENTAPGNGVPHPAAGRVAFIREGLRHLFFPHPVRDVRFQNGPKGFE